jgi:primary-amine oxidase
MSTLRTLGYLFAGLLVCLLLLADAPAQVKGKKQPKSNEIIQTFPTNDAPKTAWKIHWGTARGNGLHIQDAWFKKTPQEPWLQVLGDVRLSEMFVPYHSGSPRFWDVSYDFDMVTLTAAEAGPYGKLIGGGQNVIQEIRDRGVMWMDGGSKPARRGQALVVWGALSAANYRYVTEYSFHDDGTIVCRVGSTGHNYGSREFEGHMHTGLWRVDVNLGGPENNTVQVMEHIEPVSANPDDKGKAKTVHRPFNGGKEGFEDFNANKFTMLNVMNTKMKNARKQPVSYDVLIPRMGVARHHGGEHEDCTLHDFWVTRNRPGEMLYVNVPKFIGKSENIQDTDVVLWLSTACHHEPRSEDGEMTKDGSFTGATPIAWSGFELRPRNLWDRSPFYP